MSMPKRTQPPALPGQFYLITVDYDPGRHTATVPCIRYTAGLPTRARKQVETHPGLPTPNLRLHHHERAQIVATIRELTWAAAFNARVPRFTRPRVNVNLYYTRRQRRDIADNIRAGLKPCWDGLIDAGVLTDDDSAHLTLNDDDIRLLTDAAEPRIEIGLTEESPA